MNTLVVTVIVLVVCITEATAQGSCDSPVPLDLIFTFGNETVSASDNHFEGNAAGVKASAIYQNLDVTVAFTLTSLTVTPTNAKRVKVTAVSDTADRVFAKVNDPSGPVTLGDLEALGSTPTMNKLMIQAFAADDSSTVSFTVSDLQGC